MKRDARQVDMFLPYVRGSETSKAAAASMKPHVGKLVAKVYDAIQRAGHKGLTSDEAEVALGLSHQTTSARVRDLAKGKRIFSDGTKRPTRSGRAALIWRAQ